LDKLSKIVAIFEQSAPLIANKQQDKDNKQQDKDNQDRKSKRRSTLKIVSPVSHAKANN
jgi:hypothetical protein